MSEKTKHPALPIRLLAVALVLCCTAGCDQATKHLARTGSLPFSHADAGAFRLELGLVQNPGAFLSLGSSLPPATRMACSILVGCALLFLLVRLLVGSEVRWPAFLGLACVCAGGLSNLFDRLFYHGLVTDFIFLRLGPLHTGIFNVADMVIVAGILLLLASFQRPPKTQPPDSARGA